MTTLIVRIHVPDSPADLDDVFEATTETLGKELDMRLVNLLDGGFWDDVGQLDVTITTA